MKRLIALVLSVLMLLSLLACAAESEVVPEPEPIPAPAPEPVPLPEPEPEPELLVFELTPSGKFPQNPTEFSRSILSEAIFYYAPSIIFFTTPEENEIGEVHMFINGVVKEFGGEQGQLHYVIIETVYGEMILNSDALLTEISSQRLDWEMLELGEEYGFFFTYTGFSEQHEAPRGFFYNIYREGFVPEPPTPFELDVRDIANSVVDIVGGNVIELDDISIMFWTVLYDAEDVAQFYIDDDTFGTFYIFLFADSDLLEPAMERWMSTFEDGGLVNSGYMILLYAHEFAVRHTKDEVIAAFLQVTHEFVHNDDTSNENDNDSDATADDDVVEAIDTLVGTWLWMGSPYYVFNTDGTGTMSGMDIRWRTRGGVLSICNTPATCGANCIAPAEWRYTLDGNNLTLTSTTVAGMTFDYTRR